MWFEGAPMHQCDMWCTNAPMHQCDVPVRTKFALCDVIWGRTNAPMWRDAPMHQCTNASMWCSSTHQVCSLWRDLRAHQCTNVMWYVMHQCTNAPMHQCDVMRQCTNASMWCSSAHQVCSLWCDLSVHQVCLMTYGYVARQDLSAFWGS